MASPLPKVHDIIDGTFRVEERLGNGAAGTGFAVTLTRSWAVKPPGARFCLKWYDDAMFSREAEPNVIARRVREALIGGSLDHQNLVKVYDTSEFWVGGKKPRYLLMDLIPGVTLEKLAKSGSVVSDHAQRLLLDTARGLAALHERKILHRDVKAANVMTGADGRAILLDLGVVRPDTEETMTDTQGFLGTLRFAAPEWLFAEECSEASDVYSLGTIAYSLLTGREIFSEMRLFTRVVEAVRNQHPTWDFAGWDARRRYLANLTRRMLAKLPKERPSMAEVIRILEDDQTFQVWAGLEESGLFRQLPDDFHGDCKDQRDFVQMVRDTVPEPEFREIAASKDYDRLIGYKRIRHAFNLAKSGQLVADYQEVPPEERAAWLAGIVQGIYRDHDREDGQKIEHTSNVVDRIYKSETSEEVRKQLKPILDQAEADMRWLINVLIQENP